MIRNLWGFSPFFIHKLKFTLKIAVKLHSAKQSNIHPVTRHQIHKEWFISNLTKFMNYYRSWTVHGHLAIQISPVRVLVTIHNSSNIHLCFCGITCSVFCYAWDTRHPLWDHLRNKTKQSYLHRCNINSAIIIYLPGPSQRFYLVFKGSKLW